MFTLPCTVCHNYHNEFSFKSGKYKDRFIYKTNSAQIANSAQIGSTATTTAAVDPILTLFVLNETGLNKDRTNRVNISVFHVFHVNILC